MYNYQQDRKASLRLRFIIVGAGIAGLSCAYSLRQAGHDVQVLEGLTRIDSPTGVKIPPNMSRILYTWGLRSRLQEIAGGRCPKVVFRSASSGEFISEVPYIKEVMNELEADVYLAHHGDCIRMLYDLAVGAGAKVRFNARVTKIDKSKPSVTLSSGEEIYGDLIIGADGDNSIIRPLVLAEEREETEEEKEGLFTTYTFTVPSGTFKNDKELIDLMSVPSWNIFLGDAFGILIHPTHSRTSLSATVWKRGDSALVRRGWTHKVPVSESLPKGYKLVPMLERLWKLAGNAVRSKLVTQSPLENWFDDSGHLLLIGDAAHNVYPNSAHSASLAVEDAVVLGKLFATLTNRKHIKTLLSSFQDLRQRRCESVRDSEIGKIKLISMPAGPESDARDSQLREATKTDWENMDEGYLREQWEEFVDVFGYNAFEDADTWMVEFGFLLDRTNGVSENGHCPNDSIYGGQILIDHHQY